MPISLLKASSDNSLRSVTYANLPILNAYDVNVKCFSFIGSISSSLTLIVLLSMLISSNAGAPGYFVFSCSKAHDFFLSFNRSVNLHGSPLQEYKRTNII